MPYAVGGVIHFAIAIFFAVHAMRTGRNMYWIMILLSFPLLGSLVYLLMEYMPDMKYSRGGRKVIQAVNHAIDPNRALREAEANFERAPTVAHRVALASALSDMGRHEDAITHYREAASGSYANDAHLVRSLASTYLLAERWRDAREAYGRLSALSRDVREADDDLGYAFALGQLNDERADRAFQDAVASSTGPVARCRYAQYLEANGRTREARELYEAVVKEGRLAPKHTQDLHKAWYKLAAQALATNS
ncbi:MAG: hypothetical protein EAZ21_12455 [Betaproteobacteria bacterium]|nr:MAG: hypothetical protein EAZ21_12455 [Betaproteobacteria bacterium]